MRPIIVKVSELTEQQEKKLDEHRLRWLKIGLSSGTTDRKEAEAAINAMYKCAGLHPPYKIVWYPSPMALWLARATLYNTKTVTDMGRTVDRNVWDVVLDMVESQVEPVVLEHVRLELERTIEEPLTRTAWARVADQIRTTVAQGLRNRGYQMREIMLSSREGRFCGFGNLDAPQLASIDFLREVCDLKDETRLLLGLIYVAMTAGWYMAFERACWVSEKPQFIRVDEQNRLHSDLGPAVRYSDGFEVYALKGVMVPDWLVTDPARLTTKDILQERNIEVRRIMLDVFGPEKYLRKINARCISSDDFGSLYRAEFQGDEPLVMVKVVNSTPEPDGSSKNYWIRVPHTVRTAHEAVAWTFNLKPEDYLPGIET